ncbi:protein of unknown function (plasmid) [Cupriavidus taiwanensis]|nr:protein of unknown function [Cupriavidus taiwanensis]
MDSPEDWDDFHRDDDRLVRELRALTGISCCPALSLRRARMYDSTPRKPNMAAGIQANDWLNTAMPVNNGLDPNIAGTTPRNTM